MHFVYMVRNTANALYVGVTNNPDNRLEHHNTRRGADYTKRNPNFSIVFLESYETLAEARKREIQIKKWRRDKKDILISRYGDGLSTKQ